DETFDETRGCGARDASLTEESHRGQGRSAATNHAVVAQGSGPSRTSVWALRQRTPGICREYSSGTAARCVVANAVATDAKTTLASARMPVFLCWIAPALTKTSDRLMLDPTRPVTPAPPAAPNAASEAATDHDPLAADYRQLVQNANTIVLRWDLE